MSRAEFFHENSAGVSYKKVRARHSDEHKKTPRTVIEQHKTRDMYMKTPPESSRYAPTRRCERLGAKNITWSLAGSTLESNKMTTDIDKEERGDYKVMMLLYGPLQKFTLGTSAPPVQALSALR